MSHFPFGGREEVDSQLLVVGSQTASLTPGPSFAHNLGDRCSNGQCEAIFDIYVSRPFQWHQEHLNARCFGPCCRTLDLRESRRTPSPQLWECWNSPLHLAKVGLRHTSWNQRTTRTVWMNNFLGQFWDIVSQPHFGQVWGWNSHSQSWGLRVLWDSRMFRVQQQRAKHLTLGCSCVIGKVLKCRCPKWPRIGHLDICSPSYG
jgi:hypothetical protein